MGSRLPRVSGTKRTMLWQLLACAAPLITCPGLYAQTTQGDATPPADATKLERSPWLVTPVVQSNPKLGNSFGALGGYLHNFDEKSRPSVFALQGQYTSTDSIIAGGFAKTSFDEDRQRLIAGLMYGYIKNDYDDYLGTGVPLKSNAELRSLIARYMYRVKGNWFVLKPIQGIVANLEYAQGKDGNYGVYLKMGYAEPHEAVHIARSPCLLRVDFRRAIHTDQRISAALL